MEKMCPREFSQQFSKIESILVAFAVNLTKDREEANDLFQDTAYKAFKYRYLYRPDTNLKAWLITIMKNTFINNYRSKKRKACINDQTDSGFYINSGDVTVENEGLSTITIEELEALVGELDEIFRMPFWLRFQGYKYDEISEMLGVPLGTVKSRIHFARQQLKKAVKENFGVSSMYEI
jgi:RNA polymerase sigma-70 factor (ECF subfamily)